MLGREKKTGFYYEAGMLVLLVIIQLGKDIRADPTSCYLTIKRKHIKRKHIITHILSH